MNAPTAAGALLDARYRVGSVIARGGMSTVYRGIDTRLDRPVAIKIMESRMAGDPAFRTRFEREARSAARIDHPAVVDVYDQGDDRGPDGPVLFLVMELVEGGTLRDVLRERGPLGVPAALAVMEPVLAGLAEAHRFGLVHRDIKPENVLISDRREVKVADFGLVTAAAQAGHSHAGMIMGTVAYLSPEQVATGAADARSDVYAAGVLLYELLTGAPPYTGDSAISVAYQHVNSEVPAPSLIAGDVPPELDDLVLRATRRDPAARPADAAAMLAELRRIATLLAVPRVPAPAPPHRVPVEQDTVPHRAPAVVPAGPAPTVPAFGAAAGPGGTRAMPRPTDALEDPTAIVAEGPPSHLQARRRSRRVFALWIAVILMIGLAVGVSAWWFGSGRWTAMPPLVGVERTAAERMLAEADLVAKITTHYDEGVAAGLVSATDPAPQARLLRGSSVALTVSTGRPQVPAIAPGTTVGAAEQALRDAGLAADQDTDDEYSDTVTSGAVVRTDPAAGTKLAPGTAVTLVQSKGAKPKQVEVPPVIGQSFDDAKKTLEDLGLVVKQHSTFPFFNLGRVTDQSPNPGKQVAPGSTVTLDTF
ncbi:Stk1 family PASTA domain-containing Ser/Thr kinase [Pseudonocardia sp. GCM10023141]|uniref:Stk1 family PASTA domain-containing Ser/Thr kinase n=1 Tax=Pseudonocardia sp. GCM10023141 TaxID=3252653 RepID=UPI00361E0AD5